MPPTQQQPTRNLLIVHTPGSQDLSDWLEIARKINARAPDIDVRVAGNLTTDSLISRWQVTRPCLVFSPCNLLGFKPVSGKVYVGRALDKMEEHRRLVLGGIPTPRTVALIPGLSLDPKQWGEFVLVKPRAEVSSKGRSIRLARAATVGTQFAELTLHGQLRMIVQDLIDTTDDQGRLYGYRVLTIFGHPLYLGCRTQLTPRPPLAEICDRGTDEIAHNSRGSSDRDTELAFDEDVLALARRAAKALPELPCLGLDIVRERSTGELSVIESNSGGNVWHLSSASARELPPEHLRDRYLQFGALDIAADALIERTRNEASWFAA
jgi:hypothetical protein